MRAAAGERAKTRRFSSVGDTRRFAADGMHNFSAFAHTKRRLNKEGHMITVIALILVIIGSINWLSVGIFDFNIVNWMFSTTSYVGARVIYGIVGVAGLWALFYLIYNRFSAKRINAPETAMSEKRKTAGNR